MPMKHLYLALIARASFTHFFACLCDDGKIARNGVTFCCCCCYYYYYFYCYSFAYSPLPLSLPSTAARPHANTIYNVCVCELGVFLRSGAAAAAAVAAFFILGISSLLLRLTLHTLHPTLN